MLLSITHGFAFLTYMNDAILQEDLPLVQKGLPFKEHDVQAAIQNAQDVGNTSKLETMVQIIQEEKNRVIDNLANVRVDELRALSEFTPHDHSS